MNIFVGNLSFGANEGDVKKLFEDFGNVASVGIVMRKEKKAPKSRGFGFVQMPDQQQALAAIAALNGKEFMGRVLDIDPARPKAEAKAENPPLNKHLALKDGRVRPSGQHPALKDRRVRPSGQHPALKDRRVRPSGQYLALKDGRVRPSGQHPALKDERVRPSGQPGTYKGGRRTHSYMKRLGLTGMQEEAKPRQRSQDNPMRWRKKKDQVKPRKKPAGDAKPWGKGNGRPTGAKR